MNLNMTITYHGEKLTGASPLLIGGSKTLPPCQDGIYDRAYETPYSQVVA